MEWLVDLAGIHHGVEGHLVDVFVGLSLPPRCGTSVSFQLFVMDWRRVVRAFLYLSCDLPNATRT